ncbi:MAG: YbbR-like domain-containing protein [Acidobacteria bacterium]|nr:YbbR-like domain-containing protein [Acidobacteriota bacterium]
MRLRRLPPPLDSFVPDSQAALLLLLSVAVALLYWAFTVSEERSLKDFSVPVQFYGVAQDQVVTGDILHSRLTVEVRGTPDLLRRVREEDIEAKVDVSHMGPGPQVYEMGNENIRLPSSIELVRVIPSTVHFTLDKRVRKTLPLEPNFVGLAPRGLQVLSWVIEPAKVTVEGPEGMLAHLGHVQTQPVPVDGRAQDFDAVVIPIAPDPEISIIDPQPYHLHARVGERRAQRSITPVTISVTGAAPGWTVTVDPSYLKVMVDGPESAVVNLRPSDIVAEVNLRGLSPAPAPYQLRPAVHLADAALSSRVEITSWIQRFVEVKIEAASQEAKP